MAGKRTSIKARATIAVCGMMTLFVLLLGITGYFLFFRDLDAGAQEFITQSAFIFVGISVMAIIATGACLYLMFGRFLQPITRLKQMADHMSQGELSFDLPAYNVDDGPGELGELAELGDSLRKTGRLLKAYVDDIDRALERMSRGDFTVTVAADYVGDFSSIKISINSISDSLHNVFVLIDDAARRTMGGSYQVSGASGRLSAGVTAQNSSVEALADSMEELRRQISESASHASRADRAVREADEDLRILQLLCDQLQQAIRENRTATLEAYMLIDTLDKLAMQTGMLSINASTEAIRSGKMAYGFATVADEIHQLSNKSCVAARQASEQITHAREAGERGQIMSKAVTDALRSLSDKSKRASSSVKLIAAASAIQSQAVNRVRKDVSGISSVVHSNAQVAEQCGTSSTELTQQAQNLARVLSAFYTKDSASHKSRVSTRFSARDEDFVFHDFQ